MHSPVRVDLLDLLLLLLLLLRAGHLLEGRLLLLPEQHADDVRAALRALSADGRLDLPQPRL